MSKAQANRASLYYHKETLWGENPTGAFTQLRLTGESLDFAKQTVISEALRADRMIDDLALVGFETSGDINFELSYGSYDDLFEALTQGTWSGVASGTPTTLKNGVVERSFAIEKKFADISKFAVFTGMEVSSMELDVTALQIIKGKFAFMGKKAVYGTATSSTSLVAPTTSPVMTASANVGNILYGGSALTTGIKDLKLTITNAMRKQEVVASQYAAGIGQGTFEVKGTVNAYFEDLTLISDVISHTTSSLAFDMTDSLGNIYTFTVPALKWAKGNAAAGKKDEDIMIPLEFQGIYDPSSTAMFEIARTNHP
jgi:hypothetical protein